jgi:hypothetical protein
MTVMLFVAAGSPYLNLEAARESDPLNMRLVVCENARLTPETLLSARTEIIRIFHQIGVDITWQGTSCDPSRAFVPRPSEGRLASSSAGYFMIVVLTEPPRDWPSPRSMGMAALRSGPYRRAYVFYQLVMDFVRTCSPVPMTTSSVGIVLGHVIAHELGHLLLPGEGHTHGIMRHYWGHGECNQALSGNLSFQPEQVKRIRYELRSK